MNKVLVTGGLGYIGSYFVDSFQNKYDIKIYDSNFFSRNSENKGNIIYKDIRNISLEDLKDIEAIVHMAELSNDPLGDLNKEVTRKINHEGTMRLLEIANRSNVKKVIYMSSASVYGFSNDIVSELSTTNPLTEYAKAKVNNENFILDNEFSFQTIILRNLTAFGYSKNLRLDLVVNDLTFDGFFNKKIKLLSDGTPKRPLVHIHDICKLIDLILIDTRNLDKEIINVGSDNLNFSIKEVAEVIGNILNLDDIVFGKKDADQRSYQLTFDKLKYLFPNFQINFSIKQGVEDLIKNFEKYNLSGNEKRLKALQNLIENKKIDDDLYFI